MMWSDGLFEELESLGDGKMAVGMAAYMKNQFKFLGVPTPVRRKVSRKYFQLARGLKAPDFDFVDRCYASDYREFQYVAVNYLQASVDLLKAGDMAAIELLITTKSWWDTVDGLDNVAGRLAEKYPSLIKRILAWSQAEDFWLRRAAIDHQLYRKEKTDPGLLEKIIINNLGQKEFFINKAIGWALREFSKTDPAWVGDFIGRHRAELSKLSLREVSKYL